MENYRIALVDGKKYRCRGLTIAEATVNLAIRHPELIGQMATIGGCRVLVTMTAND